MSDLIKSAEAARKFLKGFQAFEDVAKALDAAGVAEQRRIEAEAALPALHAERDKLAAAVAAAKQELSDTQTAINNAQAQAVAASAAIKKEAEDAADKLRSDAEEGARAIAKQCEEHVNAADQKVIAATQRAKELDAECDALEAKLAKLRATASKLLGAAA
jgi:chromosome segregation ATPase